MEKSIDKQELKEKEPEAVSGDIEIPDHASHMGAATTTFYRVIVMITIFETVCGKSLDD